MSGHYIAWRTEGTLLPGAFECAPDEDDVRTALFTTPPVEWNRLPHFQDVTIRLIAERGVFHGKVPHITTRGWTFRACFGSRPEGESRHSVAVDASSELYLEDEAAFAKVSLPPPLSGRKYHLFCSEFNAGALALAEELRESDVFVTKASAALSFTTDVDELAYCDHMLVLLDERTWTSGCDTASFIEHIHNAMRTGVHISCVHEFPAVVGPPRHACDFALMYKDDWTPAHLTGGPTNLYKEMELALKGEEWRQPGLVGLVDKLATSARENKPIKVVVPTTYKPKTGANPWAEETGGAFCTHPRLVQPQPLPDPVLSVVESHREHRMPLGAAAMPPPPAQAAPQPQPPEEAELGELSSAHYDIPDRRSGRSGDLRDDMHHFGCATREHPPSRRVSRESVKQARKQSRSASRSSGMVGRVVRARGNSVTQDPSACWLAMRLSSSGPGASEPGAARARKESLSA